MNGESAIFPAKVGVAGSPYFPPYFPSFVLVRGRPPAIAIGLVGL